MKKLNILLLGGLLAFGLASCEMKDELWGEKESTEKGLLDLGVALKKAQQTKAGGETADFPVIIEKADGTQADSLVYSEIEGPIEVTVGAYTIRAHSAEKLQKQMDVPYYAGETDVVIEKGVTAQANVSCTMKNTKISFSLSSLVGAGYESWTVTANAEGGFIYEVKSETDNVAPVYWYLDGTVSQINVDVTAVKDGKTYKGHRTFGKKDSNETYEDDDSQFFGGGESLIIQINPKPAEEGGSEGGDEGEEGGNEGEGGDEGEDGGEDDKPNTPEQGAIGDFEISVDIDFEDSEATVDVPVDGTGDDSTTTPDDDKDDNSTDGEQGSNTGGGGVGEDNNEDSSNTAITISDNGTGYLTNGVTVSGTDYPKDVAVVMNVPNGIKDVYVKIQTTNSEFKVMVEKMGLVDGNGMDLTSDAASELASLFTLPQVGATTYTFTMSETLFGLLGNYAGKHDFTLTIIDANGEQESATLTINL